MYKLHGIAVSSGVAIGEALVLDNQGFCIPQRFIAAESVDNELQRFQAAADAAAAEIEVRRDAMTAELGPQYGAIFSAHLQMVRDPQLHGGIAKLVRGECYSAEYAVRKTLKQYADLIQRLGNGYLAERASDIHDIERVLLEQLQGGQSLANAKLERPVVIIAHHLTPSETANLDREFTLGFVTETGGAGGHTAIVAEAMGIPAVVGVGPQLEDVTGGDWVIVDGEQGNVIVRPDEVTLKKYRRERKQYDQHKAELAPLGELPARTLDGVDVHLLANIEFPREVSACLEHGVDGIGLFRTEFLFLGKPHPPTELEQYGAYRHVAQAMNGRPVTIRTLDLGADKVTRESSPRAVEPNPFLGLRSIRLSLRDVETFRVQLRAILRASAHGKLQLMFPLISTVEQLHEAKAILAQVMDELDQEKIVFDRKLPVGMMVEVPAAVMMLDRFVTEVDFVSIGTNDLIQYALAVDRGNEAVAELYDAANPAVLRLIRLTAQAAAAGGIEASLCGQMSANPLYTMLLVGLGLRLSAPPTAIPEIKRVVRSVDLPRCQRVAEQVFAYDTSEEIRDFLET
ncbi:MAG: phosphoenolpyruvate--protein phosphotransferase, partial [Planctomycetales bacterium]|nr:phosphoenolpyruvate--protein phosphotransferase [Planctomycetales bacterium]